MIQPADKIKIRHLATSLIAAGALGLPGLMAATAAQSVALDWKPSTSPNVAGYRIYYGPAPRTYTNAIVVGNATNATIAGLMAGATYYFGAKTFNARGVESGFSNESAYVVPAAVTTTQPALNPVVNAGSSHNVRATANASAAVPPPAATLKKVTRAGNGNFSFQVAGVVGRKYVVQASSDLVHWFSVQTNTAPFTFTDKNAASCQTRFYRSRTP